MLDQRIKDRIFSLTPEHERMCVICTEFITKNDAFITESCGHLFHSSCINCWYYAEFYIEKHGNSQFCPYCNTKQIVKSNLPNNVNDTDTSNVSDTVNTFLELNDLLDAFHNETGDTTLFKHHIFEFISSKIRGTELSVKYAFSNCLSGDGLSETVTLNLDVNGQVFNYNFVLKLIKDPVRPGTLLLGTSTE